MEPRKCPVCRQFLIFRKEVRTCSVECSKIWNGMTLGEKASAIDSASETFEETADREKAAREAAGQVSGIEAEERQQRMEALKKMLNREPAEPGDALKSIIGEAKKEG